MVRNIVRLEFPLTIEGLRQLAVSWSSLEEPVIPVYGDISYTGKKIVLELEIGKGVAQ